MMSRPMALERAMKVRHTVAQKRMVRSENPAHLSLIRPVEERRADRADQKSKTLLINPLAQRRIRKKGPYRPHRPRTRIGRQIR
jgi:hypothetical protein